MRASQFGSTPSRQVESCLIDPAWDADAEDYIDSIKRSLDAHGVILADGAGSAAVPYRSAPWKVRKDDARPPPVRRKVSRRERRVLGTIRAGKERRLVVVRKITGIKARLTRPSRLEIECRERADRAGLNYWPYPDAWVKPGDYFCLLGGPGHRRVFRAITFESRHWNNGTVGLAVIFDFDGDRVRAKPEVCWPVYHAVVPEDLLALEDEKMRLRKIDARLSAVEALERRLRVRDLG